MHITFGVQGHIVVDDHLQLIDMEAPGGHIGGHQEFMVAFLDILDDLEALGLGKVPHQELNRVIVHFEPLGHFPGTVPGIGEDDRIFRIIPLEDAQEKLHLLILADMVEFLAHRIDCDFLRLDDHLTGIVHVFPGEVAHPGVQCRREQHGVPFVVGTHALENPA